MTSANVLPSSVTVPRLKGIPARPWHFAIRVSFTDIHLAITLLPASVAIRTKICIQTGHALEPCALHLYVHGVWTVITPVFERDTFSQNEGLSVDDSSILLILKVVLR